MTKVKKSKGYSVNCVHNRSDYSSANRSTRHQGRVCISSAKDKPFFI